MKSLGPKKILGNNPKDLMAFKKLSLTRLPAIGVLHGNHAMSNGAFKYGPYNWRTKKVIATIYIDALKRHITDWEDGEELASDSDVTHLGHIIASASLLLDAQATGNLIDDRPKTVGHVIAKELEILSERFNKWMVKQKPKRKRTKKHESSNAVLKVRARSHKRVRAVSK